MLCSYISSCCIHMYIRTYIVVCCYMHIFIQVCRYICSSVSSPFDYLLFYFYSAQHNVMISAMTSTYKATYKRTYMIGIYMYIAYSVHMYMDDHSSTYVLANPAYADNWLLHYFCILYNCAHSIVKHSSAQP